MTNEELKILEDKLWDAANNFRANTDLKSSEYATPILGLIFLKFADNKYKAHEEAIKTAYEHRLKTYRGNLKDVTIKKVANEICGFYIPDYARYDYLVQAKGEGVEIENEAANLQHSVGDIYTVAVESDRGYYIILKTHRIKTIKEVYVLKIEESI